MFTFLCRLFWLLKLSNIQVNVEGWASRPKKNTDLFKVLVVEKEERKKQKERTGSPHQPPVGLLLGGGLYGWRRTPYSRPQCFCQGLILWTRAGNSDVGRAEDCLAWPTTLSRRAGTEVEPRTFGTEKKIEKQFMCERTSNIRRTTCMCTYCI